METAGAGGGKEELEGKSEEPSGLGPLNPIEPKTLNPKFEENPDASKA